MRIYLRASAFDDAVPKDAAVCLLDDDGAEAVRALNDVQCTRARRSFRIGHYMPLQAILFDRAAWDERAARAWLKKHGHVPIKAVRKTAKYLRYRLINPRRLSSFHMLTLGTGIDAIYGT